MKSSDMTYWEGWSARHTRTECLLITFPLPLNCRPKSRWILSPGRIPTLRQMVTNHQRTALSLLPVTAQNRLTDQSLPLMTAPSRRTALCPEAVPAHPLLREQSLLPMAARHRRMAVSLQSMTAALRPAIPVRVFSHWQQQETRAAKNKIGKNQAKK